MKRGPANRVGYEQEEADNCHSQKYFPSRLTKLLDVTTPLENDLCRYHLIG